MSEYKIHKHEKGVTLYGKRLITPLGRLAFPALVKPKVFEENGVPKYSVSLLFDKADTEQKSQVEAIEAEVNKMKVELAKFLFESMGERKGETAEAKQKRFVDFATGLKAEMAGRPTFRDGDMQKYDSHHGCIYISCNSKDRPVILDGREASELQAGMIVRAEVQPSVSKQGVAWGISAIRLVKDDGTRFGGNAASATPELWDGFKDEVSVIAPAASNAFDTFEGDDIPF